MKKKVIKKKSFISKIKKGVKKMAKKEEKKQEPIKEKSSNVIGEAGIITEEK